MVGFGIFLTIAAFMNAWAWSYVAHYLTVQGGAELTGAYSAGYMLVTYLTTLLLSVTDSEYYPRLSAARDDPAQAHGIMNNQALAMRMLAAPLVIIFMVCIPIFVFLVLEYDKFQVSISLAQMAVIGLFFKAVYQPIAYMVLARSDSKIYLLQETLCCILLIVCVLAGYTWGGMRGLGISFAAWELLYLVIVVIVGRLRYGYVMSSKLVSNFLIQGVLVAMTAAGVLYGSKWGLVLCVVSGLSSILLSLRFFSRHTTLLPKILSRLFHVFS
jgi:O-antigen/teichoic acid export membrane protein